MSVKNNWKLSDVACPKISVDIVVYDEDYNEFLVIERKYDPKGMAFAGGFVDIGEVIKEAAIRELHEETGLSICVDELSEVDYIDTVARDPRGQIITHVFYYSGSIKACESSNINAGSDAKKVIWVTRKELEQNIIRPHFEIYMSVIRWAGEVGKIE